MVPNNFNFPSAIKAVFEQTVYLDKQLDQYDVVNQYGPLSQANMSYIEPAFAERYNMPIEMCAKHRTQEILPFYMNDFGLIRSCTLCFQTLNAQRVNQELNREQIERIIADEYTTQTFVLKEEKHGTEKSRFKNIKFKDILL